jgi:hypothetical protein
MPHASTRIRTCPDPGSQTRRSTTRSSPGADTSTAVYVVAFGSCLWWGLAPFIELLMMFSSDLGPAAFMQLPIRPYLVENIARDSANMTKFGEYARFQVE